MPRLQLSVNCLRRFAISALLLLAVAGAAHAGGGMVLQDDKCILWIDFYSAHFTAYQPDTRGNEQFCQELPDTGDTLFVLDYLHQSLKEVPVAMRIVRDFTGQGRFVKLKHLEGVDDIEHYTVFYQPPVIRPDASFRVEHVFAQPGSYLAIVTAGHPTSDLSYTAVFPFEVGATRSGYVLPLIVLLGGVPLLWVVRHRRRTARERAAGGRK